MSAIIDNVDVLRDNWRTLHLEELLPAELEYILVNLSSKLWRLDNLYYIKDKWGKLAPMRLNDSQRKVLLKFKHNKKIILKSRQQGISTLYLAYNLDEAIFYDGTDTGLQSYGLREAEKLSDRASVMWEMFPLCIKELLGISLTTDNKMEMKFSNLSTLRIGNFRGDTLQSLHVSELGKISKDYPAKAKELKTGAFQAVAKNCNITIESTAEGKSGLFYEMWVTAELLAKKGTPLTVLDFQAIFLPWYVDPDCTLDQYVEITEAVDLYLKKLEKEENIALTDAQKYWYQAQSTILKEDMTQEYPSTPEEAFNQSVEGMYYKDEYKILQFAKGVYDPNLLVFRAVDLGMNDDFIMLFFQLNPTNVDSDLSIKFNNKKFTPVLIDEYRNNGKALEYYRDVCVELTKEKGYRYDITYVPHDAAQNELIAGITRFDAMRNLGFKPVLLPRAKVIDGIQLVRQLLKFMVLDDSLEFTPTAIQNYRKKKDEKLGVYLDSPVHDEHSHPADTLRYIALGLKYFFPSDVYGVVNLIRKISRQRGFDV